MITMFLNRTVIKKEEKMEKKEERKPENIKKEEKDEDELKPGAANRSRVTRSGDESLWSVHEKGKGGKGGRRVAWSEGPAGLVPFAELFCVQEALRGQPPVMKWPKGVSPQHQKSVVFLVGICVYWWLSDLGVGFS